MDWRREILVNLGLALIYVVVGWCLIVVGDLAAFSWLIKDAGASVFP
jgi:hypothetical protein